MLLALALIVTDVVDLGYCTGWFHFSSGRDDNNAHIAVSPDKSKEARRSLPAGNGEPSGSEPVGN
jgi:hypothetical protein